jgi:hypothetical protein
VILVAMFGSGVLLYVLGSILDGIERRRRERELEDWNRRRFGPDPASRPASATPTRRAGR